jgi:hypothetical protein
MSIYMRMCVCICACAYLLSDMMPSPHTMTERTSCFDPCFHASTAALCCMCMCIHVHLHMYAYVVAYIRVCIGTYIYACAYVNDETSMCMCIYMCILPRTSFGQFCVDMRHMRCVK